jgi:hypothetical protein
VVRPLSPGYRQVLSGEFRVVGQDAKCPLDRGVDLGLQLAQLHNPHGISLGHGLGVGRMWLVQGEQQHATHTDVQKK